MASNASFEGFPDPQACPEAHLSAFRLHLLSSASSGSLASAAGVMSSLASIVPGSMLRMRSLQLRLNSAGRLLLDSDSVAWDSSCLEDLRRWPDESHLLVGLPLGLSHPSLSFTDASDSGWGSFFRRRPHLQLVVSTLFQLFDKTSGAPCSPLRVQGFLPLLSHRSVNLFADNTTALAYLRNQGGTHSLLLNSVAQVVLHLCEVYRVRLVPQFIPGCPNVQADTLNRRSQALGSEWTLCFPAFRKLLLLWPATIDLFATSLNHRLPFTSRRWTIRSRWARMR